MIEWNDGVTEQNDKESYPMGTRLSLKENLLFLWSAVPFAKNGKFTFTLLDRARLTLL